MLFQGSRSVLRIRSLHTHKQTRVRAHSCVHCTQIIYFLLSSTVMKCHQQTPHVQTCILIISFFTDEYTCAHTVTCTHTHTHTTNTGKHKQKPYSLLQSCIFALYSLSLSLSLSLSPRTQTHINHFICTVTAPPCCTNSNVIVVHLYSHDFLLFVFAIAHTCSQILTTPLATPHILTQPVCVGWDFFCFYFFVFCFCLS